MVAAFGLTGVEAARVFAGGIRMLTFRTCVQALAPVMRRGDIVLTEILLAHKSAAARTAIEACDALLEFLPSYFPELNPVEQ